MEACSGSVRNMALLLWDIPIEVMTLNAKNILTCRAKMWYGDGLRRKWMDWPDMKVLKVNALPMRPESKNAAATPMNVLGFVYEITRIGISPAVI